MEKQENEAEETLANIEQAEVEQDSNDIENIIPDAIFEGIPIEDRSRIKSFVSQTLISGVMRRNNPISEKITSNHISKLIENSDSQDKRDREERKTDKNYQIIFLIIGLAFMAFLIIFLKEDKDLLYKIIIAVISFIGGFGIGKIPNKQKNTEE